MTQLDLLAASLSPTVSRSRRKRGHVPASSVSAYREVKKDARVESIIEELDSYSIEYCHPPTSAELTRWYRKNYTTDDLLWIRRGLSDAKAAGVCEHVPHGERTCRVGGKRAVTWRVVGR